MVSGMTVGVGGLAGYNGGKITNCYAIANVTGVSYAYLGGLVGVNNYSGIIENTYATGNVTCSGEGNKVGGLVGFINGTAITNSYWNSDATQTVNGAAQSPKKGVGNGTSDGVTPMTSASMKADTFVATLNAKLDTFEDTALYKWQVKASEYPTFSDTLWSGPGRTTIEKAITIDTVAPVTAVEMANGTVTVPTGTTNPVITWSYFYINDINRPENQNQEFLIKSIDGIRYMTDGLYRTKYVYRANTSYKFDSAITADDITVTNLGSGTITVELSDYKQVLTITVTWPNTEELPNWTDGITETTTTWDNGGTISTPKELAQFAYNVNHGNSYLDKTITLANDIDLSALYWTPIGIDQENRFQGTFDGNDKKIRGLKIYGYYYVAPNSNRYEIHGLFGESIGTIKNLGVEGVNIYAANPVGVGGLIGYNRGTIENCYATGEILQIYSSSNWPVGGLAGVNTGIIKNSYAITNIFSFGHIVKIGGLVGLNDHGTITDSYAKGNVMSPTTAYAGGLVGHNSPYNGGSIINSYAEGNVTCGDSEDYYYKMTGFPSGYGASVGGLIGRSDIGGLVLDSYATGLVTYNSMDVKITGYTGFHVGGLVGYNEGTIQNSNATGNTISGNSNVIKDNWGYVIENDSNIVNVGGLVGFNRYNVTNSYAVGDVTGGEYTNVGGLAGMNMSVNGRITNCYAVGDVNGGEYANVGGLAGINELDAKIANGYAVGDVTGGKSSTIGGFLGINNDNHIAPYSYWNSDAAQVVDGVPQTSKKGIGFYDDDFYGWYDYNTPNNIEMTSSDMKAPSFVTTLNSNLDILEDTALLKWKAMTDDYPTFSNSYWTQPTKITNTGTITIGTTAPVAGASIADGICTQLEHASGPVISWSDNSGISWDASGSFSEYTYYKTQYVYRANEGYKFDRFMTYDITVTNLGSGRKDVMFDDADKSLVITVTWPVTTQAEVITINGTVRDKGGNPVAGATVALTPNTGTPNPATTGNAGQYTINNVPKGNYKVTVTLPNGGGSFTKDVTVSGGSLDIQQPVTLTYNVSGSIKDAADSSAVSGATVTLTNTTDSTKTYTGTTDINGSYTITGVPDGSYAVNVTKSGETYDSGNAVIIVSGSNVSGGSGNISVTIPTYKVTYYGNGNDSGTVTIDSASYKKGASARVMGKGSLARNGYNFTEWNTASDGRGISYKVNDTFVINGNVTLYAQWKAVDSAQIPIFTNSNVRGIETVTPGAIATELSVTAVVYDGGTLSYQWYEYTASTTSGAIAISSATNSSYTPTTTPAGITYYYVVVTNTLTTPSGVKTSTNTSSVKTVIVLGEPAASYTVSTNTLNNITLGNTSATQYQNYTTNIIADTGYYLPDRITVTMDGRALVDGVDYIYSKTSTGTGTVTVYNVTGQIAITAAGVLIPTKEYTMSFNSNGADAVVNAISGKYGDTILLPTPTKAGFTFAGWYRDSGFATSYVSTTMGKEDITLFAKWEPTTYKISGNVKDEDNANVNSASVKLMAGSRKVAQVNTDSSGDFTISGVPAGKYNLVITKGDQTITLVITVLNSNLTTGSVTLPKGKKNSIVEVKQDTPDIVVDKLNDFFNSDKYTQDDRNVVDAGGMVEIKLLVEKKDESGDNAAANADRIKASAKGNGKTLGIFMNLTVSKIITPAGGAAEQPILIDQLSDLLIIDIPLPAELQGKSGYVIYRYHGTEVQTITEAVNADGEYIEVSSDGKSIKLHTKKFSTYAVGYTTPPTNNTGDDSSDNEVPSKITIEPSEGGRIDIGTDKKTATITPDNGYVIADVIVDGKRIGSTEKYTFTDGNTHKISAVFVKKTAIPYYNQDGKKVYIGFSAIEENLYKYIAPANVTVEFMENPKNFIDNTIAWAKPSIDFVTERELFVGTGQNIFSPNEEMTRAMFVTVIGKLYEHSFGSISGTGTFSDVDAKAYYAKYVGWANENGIIKGIGENKFDPYANVTREQMAVIMYKFANLLNKTAVADVSLTYPDSASISSWAIEGAKYCQETKVIEGRTGGIFAPQESATRAEASVILQKFIVNMLK